MMRRSSVAALLSLFVLCTSAALAQNATTSLRGVVKDPSGAVVPGATITLLEKATGRTFTDTSKASGDYQLLQIPPAKYTITVASPGFGSQSKDAELLVNQPATINFALTIGANNEILNVTAEAQTLNTSDASLGQATSNATIQALPSETRNVPDLLSLQPGVFFIPNNANNPQEQDSRSGAVNGGRSDQGNVTLDGVDDNDQVNGLAFTGVLRETQDSVEEFRVTTGIANSDEGRSSGAQVSLVTKSGTNKFHGAAYEYNRPTITVSNNFFNKQAQLNSGEANRPPKLIRNIFGGDLGGPIFKDKLFFFGNYEGQRQAESAQVSRTVPTAAYQQGILQYTGDSPSGATETQTITAAQLAALDAGCTVCNTAAYTAGPGANPNALTYFNSEPAANGVNLGDGLNTGSFSFASPNPVTLNTSIVRLDYIPTDKHRIFARGNLQKDTTGGVEQFPGQGPSFSLINNTKGFTVGDTWTISPTLVNDARYGYVRQGYGNTGLGTQDYVSFRFIDFATAQTRSTIVSVPVNNIIDNLSWSKGKHTIEVGGNWRRVDQNRTSNANSFNGASSNPYWLGGSPYDPTTLGLDPVDSGFTNSYVIALANLLGTVPSVTTQSNYKVTSPTTGALLPDGANISRRFKTNEFEYFLQDSWRPTPNLTLTFGIRHTILATPYETTGQQVTPTIDTHAWFTQREVAALKGQIYEPDLAFAPSGKFYNKPGFWPKSKNNVAPRFALAYAPDNKTSIRAGVGIYYDHYGEGLVNTFDQNGSFGLSTAVTNPAGVQTYSSAPRFTGRNSLPFINTGQPPAPAVQNFPFTAPLNNFAITWGLDDKIKTPYSEAFDASVQREVGKGFTVEVAYVGRLGRHLLQQLDLTQPVDFNDPQGSGDYYTAGAQLSQLVDQNGGNASATVPTIPYFENLFPYLANFDYQGESATQAIYTNEWAPYRSNLGATTALADIDFYCFSSTKGVPIPCPANHQPRFWQDQFSSLYALSSIGQSYYNSGQVTLRHPMSHGLQTDISYTYSRSIDYGSDAERTSEFSNNVAFANSEIINTWNPALNKGVSDFDTTHIVTLDWVYQLPVGRGRAYFANSNRFIDALIGGWQSSGIFRITSGLPFSLNEPGYTTDWQIGGFGVVTGNVKTGRHFDANGNPQFFAGDTAAAINSGINNGTPVRLPYPGETGTRNNFRGDGYLDLDSGLSKMWSLGEYGRLNFAWEVYNVTNTNRFDDYSSSNAFSSGITSGTLGISSALLTVPRRMQFSLRYDF